MCLKTVSTVFLNIKKIKLLEYFYTFFYAPEREGMKTALEYAMANYRRADPRAGEGSPADVDLWTKIRLLELLHRGGILALLIQLNARRVVRVREGAAANGDERSEHQQR